MSVETQCGQKVALCGDIDWPAQTAWQSSVAHSKHVAHELTLWNDYKIPIWKRDRDFSISAEETRDPLNIRVIRYWDDTNDVLGYWQCDDGNNNTDSASVSEDATFIDSKIFILDPDNQVAFWCEYTDTVSFSCASTDMAAFKMAYGTGYFHKLRIDSVVVQRTKEWHLLIGTTDSIVLTETTSNTLHSEDSPLILCWPIVPSLAIPLDEEILEFGFYDYNEGGPAEGFAMAEAEGGKDFYYPTWIRAMGQEVSRDVADASDRFFVYYMHDQPSPLTQDFYCPGLAYGEVRGNIAKNASGDVLVSVRAGDGTYINQLYDAGAISTLPSMSDFDGQDNVRLYPVGLQ